MTSTDQSAKPTQKKEGGDDNVFAAWRQRKDSINNPAPAQGGLKPPDTSRRRSNLKDLQSHVANMKNVNGMRRLTLNIRAKSDVSADQIKQVKKENTYQLKPKEGTEFSVSKVKKAVTKLLEDELEDLTYDRDISSKLALELSEKVKDKVKELNFPRYKIAANVIVGETAEQGMEFASRCCWDHTTDNFVCITHKQKSIFATALVFGIYFE